MSTNLYLSLVLHNEKKPLRGGSMIKRKIAAVIGIAVAVVCFSGCTVHYDPRPRPPHRIERPVHKAPPPGFHHGRPAPARPRPAPYFR